MQEKIAGELQRAIETLRQDIDRVEIWAGALKGSAEPIPDYSSPYRELTVPAKDVEFRRR